MNGSLATSLRSIARSALGRPSDWRIPAPHLEVPHSRRALLGPIAMIASVAAGWFAFASAGGTVALGLFVGAAAIVLMAWSFVLAVRIPALEPLFGGLDRVYQAHRWAGTMAVVFMFLHTRLEPEVEGGIRGASESLADTAEGLAGVAELLLYGLVAASLIRWVPYRWWRLTHKFLGVPFAFASWHFYTAEKTYANGSAWGWYFGTIMVAGLVAWIGRVVGRDMLAQGARYRVAATERQGTTTELQLEPVGRPIQHRVGQFAVVKIQRPGLREPHVFTIASAPSEPKLRFFIRDLGDWTAKIQETDLVGAEVFIEAPYGEFKPLPDEPKPTWWIAGGVGITPFLSATNSLAEGDGIPHLVYCVTDRADATALHELEAAEEDGRIRLTVLASRDGNRFSAERLDEIVGAAGMAGAHVGICGPSGLVASARKAAGRLGAEHIETEAFDIRSGIGPDLSRPIDALTQTRVAPLRSRLRPASRSRIDHRPRPSSEGSPRTR